MKPVIFISAVSKELAPSRQLVANTLLLLGYEPVWQDVFGTEAGDLKKVLRDKINRSRGVIQLVGNAYGFEPKTPDPEFGPVSYTQYEALYARKRGLKVWYLQIEGTFPVTPYPPEPPEHIQRQAEYREKIKQYADLRHKAQTPVDLENTVLKLRNDLERLRGRFSAWMTTVTLALVIILGLSAWHLVSSGMDRKARAEESKTFLAAMAKFRHDFDRGIFDNKAPIQNLTTAPGEAPQRITLESRYPVWEKELGLPEGTLTQMMPRYLKQFTSSSQVDTLVRAQVLLIQGQYAEAEKLALQAKDEALSSEARNVSKIVEALRTAGKAARHLAAQSHEKDSPAIFARSLKHFQAADSLTSPTENFDQWVLVKCGIAHAYCLQDAPDQTLDTLSPIFKTSRRSQDAYVYLAEVAEWLGRRGHAQSAAQLYAQAFTVMPDPSASPLDPLRHRYWVAKNEWQLGNGQKAAQELAEVIAGSRALSSADAPALAASSALLRAEVLCSNNDYAAAEPAAKLALELSPQLPNPGEGRLFATQFLAQAVRRQGRIGEADALFAPVWEERKNLVTAARLEHGPDHVLTYCELVDLTRALASQSKHAESIPLLKEMVASRQKVLGGENTSTLWILGELGAAQLQSGQHAEAETLFRKLHEVQLRKLGPTNTSTLATEGQLAGSLFYGGRHQEALPVFSALRDKRRQTLGTSHPHTLWAQKGAGDCLYALGRHAEAETQFQETYDLRRETLGIADPNTLDVFSSLCITLSVQKKHPEATRQIREVLDALRQKSGTQPPAALELTFMLGASLKNEEKFPEAVIAFREVWTGRKRLLGPDAPATLQALAQYASCLKATGDNVTAEAGLGELKTRIQNLATDDSTDAVQLKADLAGTFFYSGLYTEARSAFDSVHQSRLKTLGKAAEGTLWAQKGLADSLYALQKYAEAEQHFQTIFALRREHMGLEHHETLNVLLSLALTLAVENKHAAAASVLKENLDVLKKNQSPCTDIQLKLIHQLGVSLKAQKKLTEASVQFQSAWDGRKDLLGKEHALTLASLEELADCQSDLKQYAPAEKHYRELHRLSIISRGAEDPHTLWLAGCLGGMLCSLERYTESEEILSKNYQSQAKVHGPLHASTLWTRDAWIYVLRQQNKDKEADKLEKTLPNKSDATGQ